MPLVPILLFCVTVMGFGIAFSLTSVAVQSIPPVWVAAGRSLIALVVLWAFLRLRGRSLKFRTADIPSYTAIGILTGVVPYTLIAWGQQFIPSGLGGVLFASSPLLTLVFGFILFKASRPNLATLAAAMLGLVGVAIAFSSPHDLVAVSWRGASATLIAAASYSVGGLLLQRLKPVDLVAFSAAQLIPASAILVISAFFIEGGIPHEITVSSWYALVSLGIFGTSIPLVCLFVLVGSQGAKIASLTTFAIPFVALLVGVIFLNEVFSTITLIGLLITLTGAYSINRT